MIIWPKANVKKVFGTPKKTLWGCGLFANLVYIQTKDKQWFEGTADVGGFKKNSGTWNVAVWLPRTHEFVKHWKENNEREQEKTKEKT